MRLLCAIHKLVHKKRISFGGSPFGDGLPVAGTPVTAHQFMGRRFSVVLCDVKIFRL